jgi:hypothetical protein
VLANEQSDVPERRNLKRAVWLAIPTWIAFAIEALGGWRYSKDSYSGKYAIHSGAFRDPLIGLTLMLVIVSPLLVFAGLRMTVRSHAKQAEPDRLFQAVLLFLIISLLVCSGSCVWSCGGHPTWSSGYE